jgi:lipopolysaccharide biosynthesis protein
LPQYHAFDENDKFWGKGFTEWRNVMRGLPRFDGHLQPKIPRDLGCYSLDEGQTMRRQFELARAAGIHGFCFYHYWFDGKRVMEKPVERLLADKTLDIPFSIMWANENWSRTWDGADSEILLKQSYAADHELALIDDLARHFKDKRYICIAGRPVFYVYRPGHIPDTIRTVTRWREMLLVRHKLEPLFFMAQSFDDLDPRRYGFDGAIEFPPHKVLNKVPNTADNVKMIDPDFTGLIVDYDDIVKAATNEGGTEYPLIRSIMPGWDNDARRPGRSTIIAGSSPQSFGRWARWAIKQSKLYPTFEENFICVNAWNEWAEGAYLEPDTHFGAAYLNEFARAIYEI